MDSRFTTECASHDELLDVVDIDGIEDFEMFLMILFDRPMSVEEVREGEVTGLGVIVHADNGGGIGVVYEFPLDVEDVVYGCAEIVGDLGPFTREGFDCHEVPWIEKMDDTQVTTAMQKALGQVRILNVLGQSGSDDEQ